MATQDRYGVKVALVVCASTRGAGIDGDRRRPTPATRHARRAVATDARGVGEGRSHKPTTPSPDVPSPSHYCPLPLSTVGTAPAGPYEEKALHAELTSAAWAGADGVARLRATPHATIDSIDEENVSSKRARARQMRRRLILSRRPSDRPPPWPRFDWARSLPR